MGGALPSIEPVGSTEETPSASISKTTPEDVPVSKAARPIMGDVGGALIKFAMLLVGY